MAHFCFAFHISSCDDICMRKQFQSDMNVGQALDPSFVQRMIGDDQIYASFKNIRGTPQYFHNMMQSINQSIIFIYTCTQQWIKILYYIKQ